MTPDEIRSLVRFRAPRVKRVDRLLQSCVTVEDWQRAAAKAWPRSILGYVEGGAEAEVSLRRNRAAFEEVEMMPAGLRDVSQIDTRTSLLGSSVAMPLALSPTGYTRMMHPEGEGAVARAAGAAGIPYTLSTVSNTSLEELAATSESERWFQLYVWRDRGLTRALIERAKAAGFRTLMVTVDTAVTGHRVRDMHSGFTMPPELTLSTVVDMATRPRWWAGVLTGPPIHFGNFPADLAEDAQSAMALAAAQFDPAVTWQDLAEIRAQWSGPLVVKGLLDPQDIARAVEVGVDGFVLSNHGGRQLDRAVAPLSVLPAVRERVGPEPTLLVDSGVRWGSDIAVAIASGADGAMIGRPYLYGLGAAGQAGVESVLRILEDGLARTMALLGVTSIEQLRAQGPRILGEAAALRREPVAQR